MAMIPSQNSWRNGKSHRLEDNFAKSLNMGSANWTGTRSPFAHLRYGGVRPMPHPVVRINVTHAAVLRPLNFAIHWRPHTAQSGHRR